jgi:hypothetical protein
MLLYDGLFVTCQGDFVTSFFWGLYFRKLPHPSLLPAREKRPAISGRQKTNPHTVVPAKAEGTLLWYDYIKANVQESIKATLP